MQDEFENAWNEKVRVFRKPVVGEQIVIQNLEELKMLTIEMAEKEGFSAEELDLKKCIKSTEYDAIVDITQNAKTLEEKEEKLRQLLDFLNENMEGYGSLYAMRKMADMSFLNDCPEWKERATAILQAYASGGRRDGFEGQRFYRKGQ